MRALLVPLCAIAMTACNAGTTTTVGKATIGPAPGGIPCVVGQSVCGIDGASVLSCEGNGDGQTYWILTVCRVSCTAQSDPDGFERDYCDGCQPGSSQCFNGLLRTCETATDGSSRWGHATQCGWACTAETGDDGVPHDYCQECEPGSSQCVGYNPPRSRSGYLAYCDDKGQWQSSHDSCGCPCGGFYPYCSAC